MPKCKYHQVCGLDAQEIILSQDNELDELCILHSDTTAKKHTAFDAAFANHWETNRNHNFAFFVFPMEIDISGVEFSEKADFHRTRFIKGANFDGAIFCNGADFSSAQFTEKADFTGTKFIKEANFDAADFIDTPANFDKADFTGSVIFRLVKFNMGASFVNAKFDVTNFYGVQFKRQTDFYKAKFKIGRANFGEAKFGEGRFGKKADFRDSEFEDANFGKARFYKGGDFGRTIFRGEATFSSVHFWELANFGKAEFHKEANFDVADFAEIPANFGEAQFYARANFGEANFGGKAHFRESEFAKGANFDEAKLCKGGDFGRAKFRAQTLFGGTTTFAEGEVYDFRHMIIEPLDLLSIRDANLGKCLFLDTDLRKAELTGVSWPKVGGRCYVYDEIALLEQGENCLPYSRIERLYRELKQNYIDRRDYERAGDFHYGEKEMRRNNPETPRILRFFLILYWAISGYGERYVRPLIWAGLLLVGCAFLYLQLGLQPKCEIQQQFSLESLSSWITASNFSLRVMTLLRAHDVASPVTPIGKLIVTFQSLLGPLFLGLFVLAIRQRLRR